MPLSVGTRLGPYEVVAPAGAGGMGEVYRARDTRLDRTVAIKVLPAHLSDDPERRQRFEREARAISSLSHPHVCALYDVGRQDGVDYLVMEYLQGETLASRLLKGPLPLGSLLSCAIQIAGALDAAHRHGLIHRDLKPGNVMLTRQGAKLLDFGLAGRQALIRPAERSDSPTFTLTAEGAILGTLQYMAPEQLGGTSDLRSDLFAFGAMLHEMATGRRAFEGANAERLVGAILRDHPPPASTLDPSLPPGLDHVVARCLAKDPEERWQSARDVRAELEWVARSGPQAGGPPPRAPRRRLSSPLGAWLALLALAGALGAGLAWWDRPAAPPQPTMRFEIDPPPGVVEYMLPRVSPDGRHVALSGIDADGTSRIWVRALDDEVARPLAGTEGAHNPFWAPDSRTLGFFAPRDLTLKRIDIAGGAAVSLSETDGWDGSWSTAGVILFDGVGEETELMRVSDRGGRPAPVTSRHGAEAHEAVGWPEFLPDGRHFLYRSTSNNADQRLHVGDVTSPDDLVIGAVSSRAVYAWPGYLLYVLSGTLVAQPFDAAARRVTGEPVPLIQGVVGSEGGQFSASQNGVLVVRRDQVDLRRLVWVDRDGSISDALPDSGHYISVALSPGGDRAALTIRDPDTGRNDIWLFDLRSGARSRLTFEPGGAAQPVWSPDGKRIAFAAWRSEVANLYVTSAVGGDEPELLLSSPFNTAPRSWSRDGRFILYATWPAATGPQLWTTRADGSGEPQELAPRSEGSFSPDGRHVVYQVGPPAGSQIEVQDFPPTGRRRQVSTEGGQEPVWTADGRTIYYLSAAPDSAASSDLWAVTVEADDPLRLGAPRRLFEIGPAPRVSSMTRYAATSDGRRILLIVPDQPWRLPPLDVYVNWQRRLEP